jgi:5-methylthioribose kinase
LQSLQPANSNLSIFEGEAMKIEHQSAPETTVKLYKSVPAKGLLIMRYLSPHVVLRTGMNFYMPNAVIVVIMIF